MLPFKINILAPGKCSETRTWYKMDYEYDFSIFQKTAGVTRFLNQLHVFFLGGGQWLKCDEATISWRSHRIYTIEVGLTITSINKDCKDDTVAPPDLKGIYNVNG